jgi:hypothetical protein
MKPKVTNIRMLCCMVLTTSLISGCAELPLIVNASEAIKFAVMGAPNTEITRETISKVPYATISAKIGSGPRSLLVLGKQENGNNHWFSADQAVIVTRFGRIVQTSGFPENLTHTVSRNPDPVNRVLHLNRRKSSSSKLRHIRMLDMETDKRFGVPVKSVFETVGPKEIEIAGIKIKTILVKEENTAFSINWSFTNFYWVDAFDGFIWKSRQHIARSFPPVDIELLKPAS